MMEVINSIMHILIIFDLKIMLDLLKSVKIIASYTLHAASSKETQISLVFLLISYFGSMILSRMQYYI